MKRNPDFLMRQIVDRYVLSPVGEMAKSFSGMVTMNSTGKFLWDCLEQEQSVDSMAKALTENYEVDFDTAKDSVVKFIEPLQEIKAVID